MSFRLGPLLLVLGFASLPACNAAPQCVIDTDCPLGDYCSNLPGGSGGSCFTLGTGGDERDSGPRIDSGPVGDTGPHADTGPVLDTGPAMDTGPARDTGPAVDTGAAHPDTGPALDAGNDAS